ncbi:crotonase/enoyl-CoA hydratase family protein [Rhizobium sp. FY34]|uniref:crotonase/enoyl-CoA hydratase family protein n=1 Tax=Rhizobium sp. FY34 TaxID=2562309 RepID=UPI0014853012|nr:crotonase/enoyl-CoA hydratase family protein [Rhizobium sp. FY34]
MADVSEQERLAHTTMKPDQPLHGDERGAVARIADAKLQTMPLPLELRFATTHYDNLDVRVDPALRTLWYYMDPVEAPSYTPGLLADLSRLRGHIQSLFGRDEGEQPLLYLVNGSKVPGIFNLGGDLGYFGQHIREKDREGLRRYALDCVDLVYSSSMSLDLPIVLISLVRGDALGGGFEAAMASDMIIAERSAKFGLPEILFNLFPGMGAYSFLSRRLDPTRATKMIMGGQIYTADALFEMGLVDLVVEDGQGEAAVREFIARHTRKHMIYRTLREVKRRVNPLTHQELIDVVDLWVEAAMQLEDADLRKIDRLRMAQTKRLEVARTQMREKAS